MAKKLQLRGGTTSEHSSFTGAVREVTVDTDKDTLVVHDGSTAGGIPLAKASDVTSTTATTAELNILDGVTATTAELNYCDGVTSNIQTQLGNIDTDLVNDTTPQLGGDLDCNGAQIQWSKGADVVSATALPVLTDGNYFDVTGTTAVTSINTTGGAGTLIKLHFDAILTLTHHATDLILPGGANITTAAGDEAEFIEYAAGDYRCTSYSKADGTSVVAAAGGATSIDGLSDGYTSGNNLGLVSLLANNTGTKNIAIGESALDSNTSGSSNVAIGKSALASNTSGEYNTASGTYSLLYNTTGYGNTAAGHESLKAITTGYGNSVSGREAMRSNTTGYFNVAMGYGAIQYGVGGTRNTASGTYSLQRVTSFRNVASGYKSASNITSGNSNTVSGYLALGNGTTASRNLCLGYYAGGTSSPFNITTETDRIVLGNNQITNAYIKVSWTVTSDERDKNDITDMTNGLDVINNITPINYVWDSRSAYSEAVPEERDENGTIITENTTIEHPVDGSRKGTDIRTGFSAQNVKAALDLVGYSGNSVVDSEDIDNLKITETNLIPFLVNAVKELSAKVKVLEEAQAVV